jgi:ribokinase
MSMEKDSRMNQHPSAGNIGRILSLGSINADFQVRTDRRPEISETVLAHDFVRLGGGKAANVALLACKCGVPSQLFAHVGDDDLAEQAMKPLRDIGVDLSCVSRVAGHATGVAMITVPPDGKKGIVMAPNANQIWSDDDAAHIAQAISKAPQNSVLVVNCEIPDFVSERAMQAARQNGFSIVLDPSPADRAKNSLLRLTDIVVPNSGEAQQLTGIECCDVHSATRAGDCLLERGVKAACIKLPDGGCVMVSEEQIIHVCAAPVEVVDTTGAGDAFAGAMAIALLEQRPYPEAVGFAVATSHCAVTRYGSQPAYPSREEIKRMQQQLDVHSNVRT